MTTKQELSVWFDRGVANKHKYMVVVCDTFDYEDFPKYCSTDSDCQHTVKFPGEMQRVMEVYDLTMPKEGQMNESRAWHVPVGLKG